MFSELFLGLKWMRYNGPNLQQGKFERNTQKNNFIVGMVRHCSGLTRQAVELPSVEIFSTKLSSCSQSGPPDLQTSSPSLNIPCHFPSGTIVVHVTDKRFWKDLEYHFENTKRLLCSLAYRKIFRNLGVIFSVNWNISFTSPSRKFSFNS